MGGAKACVAGKEGTAYARGPSGTTYPSHCRCLPWAAVVTMWWTPSRSVSSTPRSLGHRSATLPGGSSSARRSLLHGTAPLETQLGPA